MSDRYAADLEKRFENAMKQMAKDIKQLKQTVAVLEPGCYVVAYSGTIPATYTSGDPTVTLPSGTVLGPLQHLSGYTPAAGDTVALIPIGQTYIVLGKLA